MDKDVERIFELGVKFAVIASELEKVYEEILREDREIAIECAEKLMSRYSDLLEWDGENEKNGLVSGEDGVGGLSS